jgi:hypothetical protein
VGEEAGVLEGGVDAVQGCGRVCGADGAVDLGDCRVGEEVVEDVGADCSGGAGE